MEGLITNLILAIIFVIVSIIKVIGIYFDRISPRLAQKIKPKKMIIAVGAFILNLIKGHNDNHKMCEVQKENF
jgi:hypothetical protein